MILFQGDRRNFFMDSGELAEAVRTQTILFSPQADGATLAAIVRQVEADTGR